MRSMGTEVEDILKLDGAGGLVEPAPVALPRELQAQRLCMRGLPREHQGGLAQAAVIEALYASAQQGEET